MTSLADDQGKNKLALLVLGAILGAGTFTVAKNFLSKQRNAVKKAEKESKQIKDDVLRSISGIQEQFLEKHSQRLMELVAQRQEQDNSTFDILIYSLADELLEQTEVKICKVNHITDFFRNIKAYESPLTEGSAQLSNDDRHFLPPESFVRDGTFVLQEKFYTDTLELESSLKFHRAGSRSTIYFDTTEVRAAIVTCGGLCPGLNVVIRSIVHCLTHDYKVDKIWGVKWGYRGFYEDFPKNWVELDIEKVKGIQNLGGTILGSSRGGFKAQDIIDALLKMKINQLYIIGGDGTHRGIMALQKELRAQKVQISIVGIPKTVDNDIPFIDRSFGFQTACEEAVQFINAANVEAEAAENGVGIVKLMGRYCGYIAVASSLASRDVNICLIPEVHFQLEGPEGVYESIIERATQKGHCVVVIAEGAEDGLIPEERTKIREKLGIQEDIKDESGNIKSMDLGAFIKSDVSKYASEKHNVKLTVKYLDPMYAIRSVKANCDDTVLCSRLGYVSVHGVQAGYTDFSVGLVRDEPVMIPIDILVEAGSKKMKRKDYEWQRLISSTGQSNFLSQDNYLKTITQEKEEDLKRKEQLIKIKYKALEKTHEVSQKRLASFKESNHHD